MMLCPAVRLIWQVLVHLVIRSMHAKGNLSTEIHGDLVPVNERMTEIKIAGADINLDISRSGFDPTHNYPKICPTSNFFLPVIANLA